MEGEKIMTNKNKKQISLQEIELQLFKDSEATPGDDCLEYSWIYDFAYQNDFDNDKGFTEEELNETEQHLDDCPYCRHKYLELLVDIRSGAIEKEKELIRKAMAKLNGPEPIVDGELENSKDSIFTILKELPKQLSDQTLVKHINEVSKKAIEIVNIGRTMIPSSNSLNIVRSKNVPSDHYVPSEPGVIDSSCNMKMNLEMKVPRGVNVGEYQPITFWLAPNNKFKYLISPHKDVTLSMEKYNDEYYLILKDVRLNLTSCAGVNCVSTIYAKGLHLLPVEIGFDDENHKKIADSIALYIESLNNDSFKETIALQPVD